MALDDVLAAVSGGLNGLNSGYQVERQRQLKQRELDQQNQIRQDEIDRRRENDVASREELVRQRKAQEDIIDALPEGPIKDALKVQYAFSGKNGNTGNVMLEQGGATDRANITANARRDVADTGAAVTRRGQDLNYSIAGDRDATTRRGQDLTSTDRRYGIDTGATTARRGQDIGATTARRGQDLGFQVGSERNALTERGQDIDVDQGNVMETGRNTRAATRRPAFSFDQPGPVSSPLPITQPAAPPVPAAAPVVKPPSVVQQRGTIPVTPRAAAPAQGSGLRAQGSRVPDPAANPKMAALEQQAAAKLAELRATKDPAHQAAIRQQLAQLKAQRDALVGGAR